MILHEKFAVGKKLLICIFLGGFTTVALFGLCMFKYQQIVNENTVLLNERCQFIDPLIVDRHAKFMAWLTAMQNTTDREDFKNATDRYIDAMKTAYEPERQWLMKNKTFIDRRDVRFFTHKAVMAAIQAEYHYDLADLEVSRLAIKSFEDWKAKKQDSQEIDHAIVKQNQMQLVLDAKVQQAQLRFDIRNFFTHAPQIKCSNLNEPSPATQSATIGA